MPRMSTISISVSAKPISAKAASASITAYILGSRTLSLGEEATYAGVTYSLTSIGGFIVGTQILTPGS
jgi:hypothetical protein